MSKDTWETFKQGVAVLLILFLVVMIFIGGVLLGRNGQILPDQDSSQVEYLRGAYDMCVVLGLSMGFSEQEVKDGCISAVIFAENNDWYNQESVGWQYPLPEITSQGQP